MYFVIYVEPELLGFLLNINGDFIIGNENLFGKKQILNVIPNTIPISNVNSNLKSKPNLNSNSNSSSSSSLD